MAKEGQDYVKYVTQRVITYLDMPKDVRRQIRAGRKVAKGHWTTRWFGLIPFSLHMWLEKWRKYKRKYPHHLR